MLAYVRRHHVGIIALFIALGGTSYAAMQLPANSVGTRQIRPGAVTPAKLSPGLAARLRSGASKAQAAWRDPAIAAAISAAGQTVLAQKILTVVATSPWVDSPVWLRNNDNTNYYSDVGRQIVKLIVTSG